MRNNVANNIQFSKPTLRRKDMQSVLQAMVDEKIGPGTRKKEFIDLLCNRLGLNGGIAIRSYFDAIKSALKLAGVIDGSTIVTSVLSPRIYKIAAKSLGANIVLADINKETGCLSVSSALEQVGRGANFVLLHEPYCQIPVGEDYSSLSVPIIEDITQSFGTQYNERSAGSFGDIVICAFESDNIISAGGGAAILYKKSEYKEPLKSIYKDISKYEEMPDLNAALAIVQLLEVDSYIERRQELFQMFKKALMKTEHSLFGQSDLDFLSNGWIFPVVLDSKPEDIIKFANKYHVTCKPLFNNSLGYTLKDKYGLYPQATSALLRGVGFPIYPFLKSSEIDTLVKVISHLP